MWDQRMDARRVVSRRRGGCAANRSVPSRRQIVSVSMSLLAVACIGCTTHFRPLTTKQLPPLEPRRGYLLLEVDSTFPIEKLSARAWTIDVHGSGHQFLLYSVPAGTYDWSQMYTVSPRLRYMLSAMHDRERRTFHIHPGAINYAGQLRFTVIRGTWVKLEFVNRSSFALDVLLDRYPELFRTHDVVYTGFQRDDFLETYQIMRRRQADASQEAAQ